MEKIIFAFIVIIAMLLSSCTTTTSVVGPDRDAIITNQKAIQRVEGATARLNELNKRAEERLTVIQERAARIGNIIDRLEYLFNEYDRVVREFVLGVDGVRDYLEDKEQTNNNNAYSIRNIDSDEARWLYLLRTKNKTAKVVRYIIIGA